EDNGEAGLGGSGQNLLFQDCIVRRNNWKGFDPGNEGGGCKFVNSDGVRVVNVESYENTGPGWWFDWSNRNFEVTGCTFHGNRFPDWRNFAVNTSLGTWSNTSAVDKKLTLDGNTYDAPRAQPLYNWAGHVLKTLADVRTTLGVEPAGAFALVRFTAPLDKSMT